MNKIFKELNDMGISYNKKDTEEKWKDYYNGFAFKSEKDALIYMTEDELNDYLISDEFLDKNPFPSIYDFINKYFH